MLDLRRSDKKLSKLKSKESEKNLLLRRRRRRLLRQSLLRRSP